MITLGKMTGFTGQELQYLREATDALNRALAEPAFIAQLMTATYDNTDDDNATIVAKITAPILITEEYCRDMGWQADHVYHTVAAEDSDGTITFNRPYFDNEDLAERANTQFHESCHKAGYSHRSSTDYMSVPYQAGNLLEAYLRANPHLWQAEETKVAAVMDQIGEMGGGYASAQKCPSCNRPIENAAV